MTFSVSLDLAGALAGPERCPECHGGGLEGRAVDDRVVFRCPQCHRCWVAVRGVLTLADPSDCRSGAGRDATGDR